MFGIVDLVWLFDSNIIVHLIQRHAPITQRVERLDGELAISALTRAELEGGVYRNPVTRETLRERTDAVFSTLSILPFDDDIAAAYGAIIAVTGFSRSRVLDRMIAATALVHGATLVTINAADFRDIPSLKLEIW